MNASVLILGAGLAGLRCGIELLHKRPSLQVVLLEKYTYTGGRVVTYHKTLDTLKGPCRKLQWENGAGRISLSHKKVMALIHKYKLTQVPIGDEVLFEETGVLSPNLFTDASRAVFASLEGLPSSVLGTKTLREILETTLGKQETERLLIQFPYRAEVDTLRADLGLRAFQEEMGTYKGYCVVQEGLSAIVEGMRKEFESLGGTLLHSHEVKDISKKQGGLSVLCETPAGPVLWEAPTVICALHRDAMAEIPFFQGWKTLSKLRMEPLLRTYAVFPVEKGTSWFSNLPKVVNKGPIRFFLPMNPACGTVMISYTESQDARALMHRIDKDGEEATGKWIVQQVRQMFPDRTIPDPLFFKAHPWTSGCTYWLPGSYDVEEESKKSLKPFSDLNLYCCGESFSLRQAWMEGALEQADLLLKTYF